MVSNEELVGRIKAGENVQKNLEALYLQNEGMIGKLASHFCGYAEIDDLKQEAFFGLLEAVNRWDESKGTQFATYAYEWIKQSMQRYISSFCGTIRIPEWRRNLIIRYKKAVDDYYAKFHREPTSEETAHCLGISPEQIEQIKIDACVISPRSTSESIGDDLTLGDTIQSPTNEVDEIIDEMDSASLSHLLWGIVDDLEKGEASVIRGRYKDGLTIKSCGESLGIASETVRKLEQSAIRKMQKPQIRHKLEPFVEEWVSIAYKGGLESFAITWTSSTERAVIYKNERKHR